MNFEGLQPWKIQRWGGEADWDDVTLIPNGMALMARNSRFRAESTSTRHGRKNTMTAPIVSSVAGIEVLNVLGPAAGQVPLVYLSEARSLMKESPSGTGSLALVKAFSIFSGVPATAHMLAALAYNRAYFTLTDYETNTLVPWVLDGPSGVLTPVSQTPTAGLWTAGTFYRPGDLVRTSQNPQRWFLTPNGGLASDIEPDWPTLDGYWEIVNGVLTFTKATALDVEGPSTWEEWTPGINSFLPPPRYAGQLKSIKGQAGAPAGTIAAGLDVYVTTAFQNANGESVWTLPYLYGPTVANDVLELFFQFQGEVPGPTVPPTYGAAGYGGPRLPQWLQSVMGLSDPVIAWPPLACLNVYVAAVPHGSPAPTKFGLYQTITPQSPVIIQNIPPVLNIPPRTVPTAALTKLQYVGEGGTRNAVVLREDNNESLSPCDMNAAIPIQFQGQSTVNILNITRDAAGNVNATVTDISQFGSTQQVSISVPPDPSLSGTVTLTGVIPGALPEGILQWVSSDHTQSVQTEGTATTASGPPPVAVLPPGGQGSNVALDILALTVAGQSVAGPYTYIPEADPVQAHKAFVVSIQSVVPGSADAVLSTNLASVAYFPPGAYVVIAGANPPSFDGLIIVAALYNDTIVFASPGIGGGIQSNCSATIQQELPTTQPDSNLSLALTSIARNAAGYVTARLADISILQAGHRILCSGTGVASLNEVVQLTAVIPDENDLGGLVNWQSATMGVATAAMGILTGVPGIILNFDDNFLSSSLDVTDQLTAIGAPACIDIYYSPSLDRMVYTPVGASTHYFSNIGDAENVDNPGGILGVEQQDGFAAVCFREMPDGELLSLKENGGFLVTPSDNTPNEWTVTRRWGAGGDGCDDLGPVGPDAAKVGKDFLVIFAQGSGPYRYYQGQLIRIGYEKQGTWDRLSWDYAKEVCIEIDEKNKRVLFAVPLDGSEVCNYVEVLDYANGWDDPLIVMLDGLTKPNRYGRRWSEWPMNCRTIKCVKRTLDQGPTNPRINKRQTLFGLTAQATGPDSSAAFVQMEVPNQRYDDGFVLGDGGYNQVGIDWRYKPALASTPKMEVCQWEGMSGRALGNGPLLMAVAEDDPTYGQQTNPSQNLTVPTGKTPGTPIKFAKSFKEHIEHENLSVVFSNGAVAGNWGELHELIIWYRPKYVARQGESGGV